MFEWIIFVLAIIALVIVSCGCYQCIDLYRFTKEYSKFLAIVNEHGYSFDAKGHLKKSKEK
jgi:uncharacterized C2H2 Zn-finger protein